MPDAPTTQTPQIPHNLSSGSLGAAGNGGFAFVKLPKSAIAALSRRLESALGSATTAAKYVIAASSGFCREMVLPFTGFGVPGGTRRGLPAPILAPPEAKAPTSP